VNQDNGRRSVSRRMALTLLGAAVPALALSTNEAWASKMSQRAARYQDTPKNGKDCKGCKFFEAPSDCKLVEGSISPNGWCILWQAA
jgi:hypothetical protein